MLKGFVDGKVVVSPRKMGGRRGFDACAGGAGDGVDVDFVVDEFVVG